MEDTQERYLAAVGNTATHRTAVKILTTLHGQLLDARGKLPEAVWARFDAHAAPALVSMAVADAELRTANSQQVEADLAVDFIAVCLAWTNDLDQATQRVLIPAIMAEAHRRLDSAKPELAAYIDDGFQYVTAGATKLEAEVPMYQGMGLLTARMEM